jgi:hypothetical protein
VHQSFLNVERYRYAIYAAAIAIACSIAYVIDSWHEHPSGDTVLGYTLGGIAAALVLFLLFYGVRRRLFAVRAGSTNRWLSNHVYLGLCVVLVATLHCGLQFGLNVHTLAYALMCLVVLSGCWGVYAYLRYPSLIARERGPASREQLLKRLAEADTEALSIANALAFDVRELIIDAISRTRLGGTTWAQLSGIDHSMLLLEPSQTGGMARLVRNRGQAALIEELALRQAAARDSTVQLQLHQLLTISGDRAMTLRRLRRDIQLQGLLQFWLLVHVPLSFGALAALAVHVFCVFFYR